jgi:ATP synthase F1 subcomplex alpha subunit
MSVIRADEVLESLNKQIEEFQVSANLEEIGTVIQVGDGVARIYGLEKAMMGEMLEFESGIVALCSTLKRTT